MSFPAVVDYSYGRPSMQSIQDYGAAGAMRYLGNDGRCIGASERDQLLGAGLGIGLIWETTAQRPLDGYGAGQADARSANTYADNLGAPHVPIYYAVDFAPSSSQLTGPIADYFRGVQSMGGRPMNAYGCAMVVQHLVRDLAMMSSAWQCAAWSYPGSAEGSPIYDGGYNLILSPYAHMLQNIGYVLGDTSDHNSLVSADLTFLWGKEGDWFDMATQDELRAIVADEVNKALKKLPVNAMWTDSKGQYEVTFNAEVQRVKRRIKSPDELNALKVARAISGDWVMDVTGDTTIFDSFPTVPE